MNKEFTFHKLNQDGIDKAVKIAEAFDLCLETLTTIMPLHTREMAICRTKLEEACFFAKKSMANDGDNQVATEPSCAHPGTLWDTPGGTPDCPCGVHFVSSESH